MLITQYLKIIVIPAIVFLGLSAVIGPLQNLTGLEIVGYLYWVNYLWFISFAIYLVVTIKAKTIGNMVLTFFLLVVYTLVTLIVGYTVAMNTSVIH